LLSKDNGQTDSEKNLNDTFCYMDNLTVGGHSQEQHDDNVKKRMEVLGRYKFTLNDFEDNQVSDRY